VVRISSIVIGMLFLITVALPQSGAQPPNAATLPEVRIGLPDALFRDVHPALVDTAAKPFKDTIQKTLEMNGSLVKAKDYKVLADQLKSGQVDIALFHGFEYAWVKGMYPDLQLVPLVMTLPKCGKVQACIVVNVASKAAEPKDLKGACVAIPKGSKAHCQMFLERLQNQLLPDKNVCCPIERKGAPLSNEEILDDVASGCGSCEAALVDISSLLAYQADKPGLGACLKVLTKSELLPAAVIVCRKDALKQSQKDAIIKGMVESTKTPAGRIFAMFWNLKGFGVVTDEYQALVDQTLKSYPAPTNPNK